LELTLEIGNGLLILLLARAKNLRAFFRFSARGEKC
jgi:hypothetical protein